MGVSVIRKKIIDKVSRSNDKQLLATIYDVLKDESKKEPLLLNDAQLKAIKKSEKEITEGKYFTDAEVRKKTKLWLGK